MIQPNLHPLCGTPISNLIKVFSNYGLETPYIPRAIITSLISSACIPLHPLNLMRLRPKLKATEISKPPVFIVGHWRSGTTYLHQLLTQDPEFACVKLLQCLSPNAPTNQYFLRSLMEKTVPQKRSIDNIQVSLDAPQEEDFQISCLSENSFYHAYYFPKNIRNIFKNFVLFEGFEEAQQVEETKEKWVNNYLYVLRHALIHAERDATLLLKDPSNTARISALLELFPKAKFIHIYRNPYSIFPSTKNLYRKFQNHAFQSIDETTLEADIFYIYQRLMGNFFDQESQIPEGNLVNVQYEALERNPLQEVKRIYAELSLPDFDQVSPRFEQYVLTQKHYKKNRYNVLTKREIDTIYEHWNFTIDRWQYSAPEVSA